MILSAVAGRLLLHKQQSELASEPERYDRKLHHVLCDEKTALFSAILCILSLLSGMWMHLCSKRQTV